jgi:phage terminase large subunit-like protein
MPPRLYPPERYARDVINGKIPACQLVKRSCQRYFDDVAHAHERGLIFRKDKAQDVIDFFSLLRHSLGTDFAGEPFILDGWELFIVWNLFGWYRDDDPRWVTKTRAGRIQNTAGTRRYRSCYIEVPRKNGKTTFAAGIGLYLAFADHEPGAEVYSAANKKDQAKICHNEATRMVGSSDILREQGGVSVYRNNLNQEHTYSKYEPLSADEKSMDGLNVHAAILDEVHAWRTRGTYTKLENATGARTQPLIFMITTAGSTDESKFCWELHEYTRKVIDNVIEDDTWFGMIYTLDDGDDWRTEANWYKANPGLGINKKLEDLRTKAKRAAEMPTELNDFLRYQLDIWVRSDTKWMPMDHWRLCTGPIPASAMESAMLARPCYAGLDLASVNDLAALVLEFPPTPTDPLYYIKPYFFVPEENILKRARNDRVPYDLWADKGYLIPTPGNVTDEKFIIHKIGEVLDMFKLRSLFFDRYGSKGVMGQLENEYGFVVDPEISKRFNKPLLIQFGQGYLSMSAPMKDVLRLALSNLLAHGDHPVLTWNMDNLIATSDPAGNIKPDKARSREKIDGGSALIMAHAGAMTHIPTSGKSIYATRGILTI